MDFIELYPSLFHKTPKAVITPYFQIQHFNYCIKDTLLEYHYNFTISSILKMYLKYLF